ncbi:hypothetical protein Z965_05165 [Clostridium novyi A str. BKT29909]|uniref:hypothetical protein n=1 Tax=Clostridium novyi TaxID=1542 RepID=UPI0004D6304D|nr:hypothetical protein [Clostridium novyi]KEH87956.1 hypothetical protein Z965_05165 [Clostridium novyi A str. BKT29909]
MYLNVLEVFQIYKNYIIKGKPDNIENVITRNIIIGQEILEECNYGKGVIDIMLIKYSLKKSIENSIWSSVGGISEKIDEYVKFLTLESNKYPIFDLWPSQKNGNCHKSI